MAACGPYPDDISGTLEEIEQGGQLRVGLTELRPEDERTARAFVARLEEATGARARLDRGPAESQLARLDQGDLDLVMGDFAQDSPWMADVAIVEPLSKRLVGNREFGLSPVVRNGENRWVAVVEREVRNETGQ